MVLVLQPQWTKICSTSARYINSSYVSENILLCLLSGIHRQDKFPKIYLRLQYYKNIKKNKNSPHITPVKAGRQMMKDPT